jgi:hypothetical protein
MGCEVQQVGRPNRPEMFSRTSTLGTVSYKKQRALVVKALTDLNSGIPDQFTSEQVAAAIDPVAYDKTFKHGKMVVTIPESVEFHLKELAKLGQLERIGRQGKEQQVAPAQLSGFTPKAAEPTQLLTEWEAWEPRQLPLVLDADRELVKSAQDVVCLANWSEAIMAPDFGWPGDTRLHLGLLPQPFIGDLRRASIYVLSLNPGLDPTDYFGEFEVQEYRNALLANLKQQFHETAPPFIFLDPRHCWHGGFRWWHKKLSRLIKTFADESGVSFASARARLATELASVELLPYHSAVFHDSGGRLRNLHSVALAKNFVTDFVLPRVKRGEAIAIVVRKAQLWGLPEISGVIRYESKDAQGAHLTPNSSGGRAILTHLRTISKTKHG